MKHKRSVWIAAVLVLALLVSLIITAFAASPNGTETSVSKYENIAVNDITGEGGNPPELAAKIDQHYFSKEWYEYLVYSDEPVASVRVDDTTRIIFYDPYEYSSSMIMDVSYEDTTWGTSNTISISHTFSNTVSYGKSTTTTYTNARQVQEGVDESGNEGISSSLSASNTTSTSTSKSVRDSAGLSYDSYVGSTTSFGSETEIGLPGAKETIAIEEAISLSVTEKQSASHEEAITFGGGEQDTISATTGASETKGWAKVADRVTTTTGSSSSTNTSWSATESTTITKTYNAAYFNSSGAPLPWTIAYYEVKMPMYYELQVLDHGEWCSTEVGYCLLTTIKGACRAWRDNVVYYEHWGTGEPVADSDFWGQFFTKEDLIAAYENKLYPD